MEIDVLIVGQGIAGSVLAIECIRNGLNVAFVNEINPHCSSRIAAGLFSPISGSRLAAAWNSEQVLHQLNETYQFWQKYSGESFLHYSTIRLCFATAKEQNDKLSRLDRPEIAQYITHENNYDHLVKQPFGSISIHGGGWVNTEILLDSVMNYFISKNAYINEKVNYSEFVFQNNCWNYKQFKAQQIIFCEGFKASENPYSSHLPFAFCKGEVLDAEIPDLNTNDILKKGVFLVQYPNTKYRIGASYEWNKSDTDTTEIQRKLLEEKLSELIPFSFQTIRHRASVRPAFRDRMPVIGRINNWPEKIYIFNGLGSKGVLNAPFMASTLIKHILNHSEIPKLVNVQRFIK